MIAICKHCRTPFSSFASLANHFADGGCKFLDGTIPDSAQPLDMRSTSVVRTAPMSEAVSRVKAALLAVAERIESEKYEEDPHTAELDKLVAGMLGVDLGAGQFVLRHLGYELGRVRDLESDHGYRRGWNKRTQILAAELRKLAGQLDSETLPSHASQAV